MVTGIVYTPDQIRNANSDERQRMIREIGRMFDRDHRDLYARLAPFDGPDDAVRLLNEGRVLAGGTD